MPSDRGGPIAELKIIPNPNAVARVWGLIYGLIWGELGRREASKDSDITKDVLGYTIAVLIADGLFG